MIIWFTGLSGSGKSTLANNIEKILSCSQKVHLIDGDIFRENEKNKNTFSKEEILKNNYQILEHIESIENNHDLIIISAISPFEETRNHAKKIFKDKYIEIYIHCPIEELIKRDTKGLYLKAIKGEIDNLVGFSKTHPYEVPRNPSLSINTSDLNIEESLQKILTLIKNNGN